MVKRVSTWLDMEKLSSRVGAANIAKAKAYDSHWSKRLMDLLIAVIVLVLLSPILLLIAVLIRIDSPGKALFSQKRVGRYGKIFHMYKFRSMVQDADDGFHVSHIEAYANGSLDLDNGNKIVDDPRITRIGKFIRRTSIDELPQLFNVLKGEMSIIGPRPVPVYEADLYNLWQSERLDAMPGITGLWQVVRRGKSSFEEQLRLDIRYIRNQSLALNLKILLLTIPALISKSGAK